MHYYFHIPLRNFFWWNLGRNLLVIRRAVRYCVRREQCIDRLTKANERCWLSVSSFHNKHFLIVFCFQHCLNVTVLFRWLLTVLIKHPLWHFCRCLQTRYISLSSPSTRVFTSRLCETKAAESCRNTRKIPMRKSVHLSCHKDDRIELVYTKRAIEGTTFFVHQRIKSPKRILQLLSTSSHSTLTSFQLRSDCDFSWSDLWQRERRTSPGNYQQALWYVLRRHGTFERKWTTREEPSRKPIRPR